MFVPSRRLSARCQIPSAAATAAGEVFVATLGSTGLAALRWSPASGWSGPILVDGAPSFGSDVDVAPGICGDDALIAYSAGDVEVRVARVRGAGAEVRVVGTLAETSPRRVRVATRAAWP